MDESSQGISKFQIKNSVVIFFADNGMERTCQTHFRKSGKINKYDFVGIDVIETARYQYSVQR